jgi:hypothetical protein
MFSLSSRNSNMAWFKLWIDLSHFARVSEPLMVYVSSEAQSRVLAASLIVMDTRIKISVAWCLRETLTASVSRIQRPGRGVWRHLQLLAKGR